MDRRQKALGGRPSIIGRARVITADDRTAAASCSRYQAPLPLADDMQAFDPSRAISPGLEVCLSRWFSLVHLYMSCVLLIICDALFCVSGPYGKYV